MTTYQTSDRVLYRPSWATEWTPALIIRQITPAGRIGRFFGATTECYVIQVEGDPHPFTTQTDWLVAA